MKKILLTLFLSLFTLTAIAENTILIIGDSLSAAYGIDKQQSWPVLLQNELKAKNYPYRIVNNSISGDTTSNGLARLPASLKTYHPAITIIALGGNDGLRGLQVKVIKHNLAEMISLAKQSGSQVLLLGLRLPPNYGPTYTKAFENIFAELAKSHSVRIVPFLLKDIDNDASLFQSDRIHPTASAQAQIVKNIWPTLSEMLKK